MQFPTSEKNISPLLSVILPVKNAGPYIGESIASMLSQTYPNFELIVVNDQSTDDTERIVKSFCELDTRVKLLRGQGRGVSCALNLGLDHAIGDFICRQDADDISIPTRFESQLNFLSSHPEIDAVFSRVEVIDSLGRLVPHGDTRKEWKPSALRWRLPFECCLVHPTMMARKQVFANTRYPHVKAEDYLLWLLLMLKGFKLTQLNEPLLRYRTHSENISTRGFGNLKKIQVKCYAAVMPPYSWHSIAFRLALLAGILMTCLTIIDNRLLGRHLLRSR